MGEAGETAEGIVTVDGTAPELAFGPVQLPLFPGVNRMRILAGEPPLQGRCEILTVTPAESPVALRVMLTWDSEGDMDTHVLFPGGTYRSGGDCYCGNCRGAPAWGDSEATLDVDNTRGYGPENIRLTSFETGTDGVLIDAFSGQSMVTARVYLGRNLVGTAGPCALPAGQDCVVGVLNVDSVDGVPASAFVPINHLVSNVSTTPDHWRDVADPYGPGVVGTVCPSAPAASCAAVP